MHSKTWCLKPLGKWFEPIMKWITDNSNLPKSVQDVHFKFKYTLVSLGCPEWPFQVIALCIIPVLLSRPIRVYRFTCISFCLRLQWLGYVMAHILSLMLCFLEIQAIKSQAVCHCCRYSRDSKSRAQDCPSKTSATREAHAFIHHLFYSFFLY